ncbi:MAG TPA: RNA polymerase sigma factor [Symbiobacteriaceae bacterium]|nr:RNA polymerase sigma factor [Symbiobacteriaceae bacterium]
MDATALSRLRDGDEAAFVRLLELFERPISRYLLSLTGDRMLAEDLVQETFLRVYLHTKELRDDAALKPWIYRIATNQAMTALRRRSRFRWLPLTTVKAAPGFEEEIIEQQWLRAALDRLPSDHVACLLLTRVEGMKSHEAAAVLGISPEAVRKRLSRVVEALRAELGGDDSHAV